MTFPAFLILKALSILKLVQIPLGELAGLWTPSSAAVQPRGFSFPGGCWAVVAGSWALGVSGCGWSSRGWWLGWAWLGGSGSGGGVPLDVSELEL